jgi:hypothetical protein
VRHGTAHQYQQITVELKDGFFAVRTTGTEKGYTLDVAEQNPHHPTHLGHGRETFEEDGAPIHYVVLRPELLFLDLKVAIERSCLLTRELSFDYLRRGGVKERPPRGKKGPRGKNGPARYDFTVDQLSAALDEAGHQRV